MSNCRRWISAWLGVVLLVVLTISGMEISPYQAVYRPMPADTTPSFLKRTYIKKESNPSIEQIQAAEISERKKAAYLKLAKKRLDEPILLASRSGIHLMQYAQYEK